MLHNSVKKIVFYSYSFTNLFVQFFLRIYLFISNSGISKYTFSSAFVLVQSHHSLLIVTLTEDSPYKLS